MRIRVTREDIENGRPRSREWCPVALALKRVLGDTYATTIQVTESRIQIGDGRIIPPPGVAVFVHRFDHGDHVYPFEFDFPGEDPAGEEESNATDR